jgi:hypothetical protein
MANRQPAASICPATVLLGTRSFPIYLEVLTH